MTESRKPPIVAVIVTLLIVLFSASMLLTGLTVRQGRDPLTRRGLRRRFTAQVITDIALMHGNAEYGGAVTNFGSLTIQDSVLNMNESLPGVGGAIVNFDSLTIQDSDLSWNESQEGGAILNLGTIDVSNRPLNTNACGRTTWASPSNSRTRSA